MMAFMLVTHQQCPVGLCNMHFPKLHGHQLLDLSIRLDTFVWLVAYLTYSARIPAETSEDDWAKWRTGHPLLTADLASSSLSQHLLDNCMI
jgi:hypothetical protein